MFKDYDKNIKQVLAEAHPTTNWKKILLQHQIMISRIQHERLIHLLVTFFVGLIMAISAFIIILTQEIIFLFISLPLLFLFLGYIFHYRFLENTTQKWYLLQDDIYQQISS